MERLQKYLASCGIASRRKCEELILQGRVRVNGQLISELGLKIDPSKDIIEVDGEKIKEEEKVYIMLNKPFGIISSAKDEKGRPTVIDLVKGNVDKRVFPVGRLDFDTTGLIILTNDGQFANNVMHPKHHIKKTYHALVKGIPKDDDIIQLEKGIIIDGRVTLPAEIKLLSISNGNALFEVIIFEGRNRQVRKMFDQIGHPVLKLKRIAIGKLKLKNIKEGEFVFLDKNDIKKIFEE